MTLAQFDAWAGEIQAELERLRRAVASREARLPIPLEHRELAAPILRAVADHFGLSVLALVGGGRQAATADARAVAMHLLRSRGLSLPAVGRVLEKHHATVLVGCRKVAGSTRLRAASWAIAAKLEGRAAA